MKPLRKAEPPLSARDIGGEVYYPKALNGGKLLGIDGDEASVLFEMWEGKRTKKPRQVKLRDLRRIGSPPGTSRSQVMIDKFVDYVLSNIYALEFEIRRREVAIRRCRSDKSIKKIREAIRHFKQERRDLLPVLRKLQS